MNDYILRIDPKLKTKTLEADCDMDNASDANRNSLQAIARNYCEKHGSNLEKIAGVLLKNKRQRSNIFDPAI